MDGKVNLFSQLPDERKRLFAEKVYDMFMKEQEIERARAQDAGAQGTQLEREPMGDDNVK